MVIKEGQVQAQGCASPYEGCDSSASFYVMERGCELPCHGRAMHWANRHALLSKPLLWVSAGVIGFVSSLALTVLCHLPPAVTYSRAQWSVHWELLICGLCTCKGERQGARL